MEVMMMKNTYLDAGIYTLASVIVFAEKTGVHPGVARTIVNEMVRQIPKAITLIGCIFFSKVKREVQLLSYPYLYALLIIWVIPACKLHGIPGTFDVSG
jgi:hypothetical protein